MKPKQKKIIVVFCVVIGVLLLVKADYYLWKLLSAAAGIEAKMLCSGVFVSKREPESVLNEDLHRSVNYIRRNVNHVEKSATATAFGVITRRAIFRKGLGCTLIADISEEELRSQVTVDLTSRPLKKKNLPWPVGDVISKEDLPTDIDVQKLSVVMDGAFSEPDPKRLRQTRAVVIVYKRHLIAEQYAEGFTKDTPLLGYGMTKSVINALVGILVYQGKLSIEEPALVPEWSTPGDPRSAITLDQLLRMSSGLKFDDSHPPLTDSIIMFGSHDMAAYASDKPLVEDPDTRWSNSLGLTKDPEAWDLDLFISDILKTINE